MNFDELPEFQKELKRLAKKYKSLPDDLEQLKKIVAVEPLGNSKHFIVIAKTDKGLVCIVKARLFCRYLKGSSLRIVYAHHPTDSKVEFIEIYFKGKKENEDQERIKGYLRNY